MFLSRDNLDNVPLYIAFIVGFMPISYNYKPNNTPVDLPDTTLIFSNKTIQLMSSSLAIIIMLYGALLSLRSIFADSITYASIHQNIFNELLPLFLLIALVNRLVAEFDDFCELFFLCISPAVASNVFFNLFHYFYTVGDYRNLFTSRLGFPSIGIATGRVATTYAIVYGVMLIGIFLSAKKSNIVINKILLYYFSVVLLFSLILTQSRGSTIALFIVFALYNYEHKIKYRYAQILLIILTLVAVILYFYFGGRISHDGNRLSVWRQSFELILQRPLIGYGELVFQNPITSSPEEILQQGHNLLINAELRGGAIALILMGVFLGFGLLRCFELKKLYHIEIPFYIFIFMILSGCVDYDIVVRDKDWDWIALWLPIGLAVGADTYLEKRGYPCKIQTIDNLLYRYIIKFKTQL